VRVISDGIGVVGCRWVEMLDWSFDPENEFRVTVLCWSVFSRHSSLLRADNFILAMNVLGLVIWGRDTWFRVRSN